MTSSPLSKGLLEAALRHTSDLVLVIDEAGRTLSSFGAAHMGYEDAALVGTDAFALLDPDDRSDARSEFARHFAGESSMSRALPGVATWSFASPRARDSHATACCAAI